MNNVNIACGERTPASLWSVSFFRRNRLRAYLECITELVAHDAVQQRIDACGHEVRNSRDVS